MLDLAALTAESFEPHRQTVFTVPVQVLGETGADGDTGTAEIVELALTLAQVRRWGDAAGTFRAPFGLTFTGRADIALEQQTVPLSHPVMGTMAIFIVPSGATDTERTYEATFT